LFQPGRAAGPRTIAGNCVSARQKIEFAVSDTGIISSQFHFHQDSEDERHNCGTVFVISASRRCHYASATSVSLTDAQLLAASSSSAIACTLAAQPGAGPTSAGNVWQANAPSLAYPAPTELRPHPLRESNALLPPTGSVANNRAAIGRVVAIPDPLSARVHVIQCWYQSAL